MASPGQKRGSCGHVMAVFDLNIFWARYHDKGVGSDPCIMQKDCEPCELFDFWSEAPAGHPHL